MRVYACIYLCIHVSICMYIYICMCVYICMYVYICAYTHTHTHTHTQARTFPRDLCTVNLDEGTISCDLSGQTGVLGGLWGSEQVGVV
jgi:hypothetical protein